MYIILRNPDIYFVEITSPVAIYFFLWKWEVNHEVIQASLKESCLLSLAHLMQYQALTTFTTLYHIHVRSVIFQLLGVVKDLKTTI